MRILIAIHHFPPKYIGGAEWEAYRTAKTLASRGHAVHVLCVEDINSSEINEITWDDTIQEGFTVRRLYFNSNNIPDRFTWEYRNSWIADQLQQLILDFQPDIFHLFGGYLLGGQTLIVAKDAGVPTLVTLLDFWFLCKRLSLLRSNGELSAPPIQASSCVRCLGEESRRYQWLGKYFPGLANIYWKNQKSKISQLEKRQQFLLDSLNKADLILSRSNFLLAKHVEGGVDTKKLQFFRQGINVPDLQDSDLKKTPSSQLRIGYLGQIAWHKGIHIILEAVQKLPSAQLNVQIFGNPKPFPKYFQKLQNSLSDPRINFAGVISHDKLVDTYRNIDVLVVPSLWYENSPNTIMEAFLYKTPVIASNLGGMAELVHHDVNGLLFAPGDSSDLATQFSRLLNNPQLLHELSNGISPVRSLTQEMDELEDIYQHILYSSPKK